MRSYMSCLFALMLAVPALLVGCSSLYKPAAIVVVTAEKAMESWARYFDTAIQDPMVYGTTQAELYAQRAAIDENWERYRASMNLLDDARRDYVAGVGDVGPVRAALEAARINSAALTELIVGFLPYQFQPKAIQP